MAALTDLQFVALNAPELSGAPLLKNGVTFSSLTDFFQAMLDTANGNKYLALASIFDLLYAEDRNQSLRLGEFEYTRRTGMTFRDARDYWKSQSIGQVLIAGNDCAPKVMGSCPRVQVGVWW